VAAISIPWIALKLGWRYAFVFSGMLGFLWLQCGCSSIHGGHPLSGRRRGSPTSALQSRLAKHPKAARDVGNSDRTLAHRSDLVVYVFWLPQYLSDTRGFSLKQIAAFAWIPFVAADLGNFAGGLSSGALIKRGMPLLRARKWICVASCIPMLAGIPAVLTSDPFYSLAFICIVCSAMRVGPQWA